ncbi:MAG TPA: hypothetical protein VHM25_21050 [Polyangiaceae bacterium]|nr:hypothetical protein [Polyangiaceae bacterium]
MDACPPMPPKDAAASKTQDPPAACHHEDPVTDRSCSEDKWTCTKAP